MSFCLKCLGDYHRANPLVEGRSQYLPAYGFLGAIKRGIWVSSIVAVQGPTAAGHFVGGHLVGGRLVAETNGRHTTHRDIFVFAPVTPKPCKGAKQPGVRAKEHGDRFKGAKSSGLRSNKTVQNPPRAQVKE